jgi:hypothetical protein
VAELFAPDHLLGAHIGVIVEAGGVVGWVGGRKDASGRQCGEEMNDVCVLFMYLHFNARPGSCVYPVQGLRGSVSLVLVQ